MGLSAFNGHRRGKLEIALDILCQCSEKKGVPITQLMYMNSITYVSLKFFLNFLTEEGLLNTETLELSWSGHERITEYYQTTQEGLKLSHSWRDIRRRFNGGRSGRTNLSRE